MIICGIKFTHDGAVSLIENGQLVFSYEMEKLNNSKRYSEIDDFSRVEEILNVNGYDIADVDRFVVDGWGDHKIKLRNGNKHIDLEVENYGFLVKSENILAAKSYHNKELNFNYKSYMHVAGHVLGAYCTSPFAKSEENSYVLIWDGSMSPQLFYYDYKKNTVSNLGPLFFLNGSAYALFGLKFPPFKDSGMADVHAAGKIMAYIALGTSQPLLLKSFHQIFLNKRDRKGVFTGDFVAMAADFAASEGYNPEDSMATFHEFLKELLLLNLHRFIGGKNSKNANICLGGGCALNIKWNSAIRASGMFKEVWVSPFPNDSGNAIGTACCEMVTSTNNKYLEWNVYSGPKLITGNVDTSWERYFCSLEFLAYLLHKINEPIVFLHNAAELGPRALGNRSIIAAPVSESMKKVLNQIKKRESYRPVAPICLVEDAPDIFSPGSPDPYMLFDHTVKEEWKGRIPAICHLDGSARLQTVSKDNNSVIYSLLKAYKDVSGIPVLCNTSANLNGSGFFPDVSSAVTWGGVDFVWSDGMIYVRKEKCFHVESHRTNYLKENQITDYSGIEV